jgi:rod shape determining protein RodA
MISTFARKFDWILFLSALALAIVGLMVLTSASATETGGHAFRQGMWYLLGIPIILVSALMPPGFWFAFSWIIYGLSLCLLLAVKLMGAVGMGAERWIDLGAFRFQPSELGKLALVLALARFLSDNRMDLSRFRNLFIALMIVGTPMLLVILQPDLGTALIYLFILYPMLIRAGLPWSWALFLVAPVVAAFLSTNIFLLMGFILLLAVVLWKSEIGLLLNFAILGLTAGVGFSLPVLFSMLHEYQRKRILVFLDPEADPLGAGYQIIQSKVAIGSGGLLGKGWMQGTQTQLAFLPERHTDFIFSVLAEEWGFLGAGLVLGLFTVLLIRALVVGLGHRNNYCGLVMTGLASILFFHVMVNAGMTMGIMPVTGLPMPFLTYGGSFVLTTMLLLGLLLNFSWHRRDSLT